ncbi:MAG: UMP kinase [Candidatus Hodarchaeales archaeon]|jgi:uridylate kinase
MKSTITLSLGGSIINPGEIDNQFLTNFSKMIIGLIDEYKFMIVCGGGKVARQYIKGLPDGLTEGERDYMGIAATWLNAQLLSYYFKGYTSPILPSTVEKLTEQLQQYDVGLSGGFLPSVKTDEDAAIVADLYGSPILINVTNVDGIYDKDPRKFPDAKKYDKLSYQQFYEIVNPISLGAGSNAPFTLIAAKICERTNMRIIITPKKVDKIQDAIKGKNAGTLIQNQ